MLDVPDVERWRQADDALAFLGISDVAAHEKFGFPLRQRPKPAKN